MNKERYEKLSKIIKENYKNLKAGEVKEFADNLYDAIYVSNGDMADIEHTIAEYQQKFGVKYNDYRDDELFKGILNLLDDSEQTVQRLYGWYTGNYENIDVLEKIMRGYKWLTQEQLKVLEDSATAAFDPEIVRRWFD
jgi:hypothetical protein